MLRSHKSLAAIALSLISFTGALSASSYEEAQIRNLENRVNALEQRRGANGVINPSGRPAPAESWGIFAMGEALIWNAHVNNLPFAVKNSGSTTVLSDAKVVSPNFSWDWGFRVGLGYNMDHDGWDLDLYWTRFFTNCTTRANAPTGGFVSPIGMNQDDTIATIPVAGDFTVASIRDHWSLHLNLIDLELGREFFVSKWLTLRPSMGLRSAWVRQKKNDIATGGVALAGLGVSNITELQTQDYWGIGIRSGLNTRWGLGAGFSIFGDAYYSLLYGFFENTADQTALLGTGATVSQYVNSSNNRITRAIIDLALGLRYDVNFYNDRFHFGLKAGWEHHLFFGQNQFFYSTTTIPTGTQFQNGDLATQGWFFGARFDF